MIAPLGGIERREDMVLDGVDQILVQFVALASDAKGAVIHVAAGAAGDLADFLCRQMTGILAVELGKA